MNGKSFSRGRRREREEVGNDDAVKAKVCKSKFFSLCKLRIVTQLIFGHLRWSVFGIRVLHFTHGKEHRKVTGRGVNNRGGKL